MTHLTLAVADGCKVFSIHFKRTPEEGRLTKMSICSTHSLLDMDELFWKSPWHFVTLLKPQFRLLSSNLTHECTCLVLLPCWMRDQRDGTNLQGKSARLTYICRLVMHGAEVSFWFGSQGESSGKLKLQCWVNQITNYYILYLDLSNLDQRWS